MARVIKPVVLRKYAHFLAILDNKIIYSAKLIAAILPEPVPVSRYGRKAVATLLESLTKALDAVSIRATAGKPLRQGCPDGNVSWTMFQSAQRPESRCDSHRRNGSSR